MSRLHQRLAFAVSLLALLLIGMSPVLAQDATPASEDFTPYAPAEATRLYALSPDGTMVIGAGQEERSLCTFAVPSGETIACANLNEHDINLREEDIRWSPNSHEVVFAERAFVYFQDGDIWTFDAQTGELTDLTDEGDVGKFSLLNRDEQTKDVYFDVAPAWSPTCHATWLARRSGRCSACRSPPDTQPGAGRGRFPRSAGHIGRVCRCRWCRVPT